MEFTLGINVCFVGSNLFKRLARSFDSAAYNKPRPLPGDFSTSASATHPPLVEMTMGIVTYHNK